MTKTLIFIVTLDADEKDFAEAESELRNRMESVTSPAPGNVEAEVTIQSVYRTE